MRMIRQEDRELRTPVKLHKMFYAVINKSLRSAMIWVSPGSMRVVKVQCNPFPPRRDERCHKHSGIIGLRIEFRCAAASQGTNMSPRTIMTQKPPRDFHKKTNQPSDP
jgi:hypothetical protein